MAGSTGSAREEAERLVATVLAMASDQDLIRTRQRVTEGIGSLGGTLAGLVNQFTGDAPAGERPATGKPAAEPPPAERPAPAHSFAGWATGSAECCVCPVCKAIAAVRDPSPATALRLATGAGDVATGAARVLRGLSTLAGSSGKPAAKPARPAGPARPAFDPDVLWSAATRATGSQESPAPDPATRDAWSAATRSPAPKPAPPAPKPAPPKPSATQKPYNTAQPDEATRRRDPWAAATASPPPIAHVALDGEGVQDGVASGGPGARTEKDRGPGSSDESAVDHDVPGPATAGPGSAQVASAADGRGGDPGDDARAGDAG